MCKAPYDPDLKWRIVWQHTGMDYLYQCIASILNIALDTVYNTLKHFRATGDVKKAEVVQLLPNLWHQMYSQMCDKPKLM